MSEPNTRRQYVPAYYAPNGTIIGIGGISGWREGAERDAKELRSPGDEVEVFVAYRDLPDWQRAEEDE